MLFVVRSRAMCLHACVCLVLIGMAIMPQRVVAQQDEVVFSRDTSKFLTQLTALFDKVGDAESRDAKQALSEFNYNWTSNLLKPAYKKQAHTTCMGLADLKLLPAPYYVKYFRVLNYLVEHNFKDESFQLLQKSIQYTLDAKNPSRAYLQYISKTELLLYDKAFMKTPSDGWYARKAEFVFDFDTVPLFRFAHLDLASVVRNDSACIYGTSGNYYPLSGLWLGREGQVYWERTGLKADVVHAVLAGYKLDTRFTQYSADSVLFYHSGYFKSALHGRLEDKAEVDVVAERATYPRFYMNDGPSIVLNLFKDITYQGGFNMEGQRVIGSATGGKLAIIEVKRKQQTFIQFRAREFIIRPNRLVSARTSATVYYKDDSIYHPGLRLRYNQDDNELIMERDEEGLGQSPFYDSYHRLDLFSGAIYWKLNEASFSFEAIRGIRSKSEALFESSDYFSQEKYDRLQGIDDANPAELVAAYMRKRGVSSFISADYADWLNKPVEQVKVQLIKLANAGLLNFDLDKGTASARPRLNEFLAAKKGVKDSDIIRFESSVKNGSNAVMDLDSMYFQISGVDKVMLSDSQYVYVVPRDGKVIVFQNRNFSFVGRVHAGLFDFQAHECTFRYNQFALSMPKVDTAAMVAVAWSPDANGFRPFVKVKNVLSSMNADLFIDAPESKSGRKMLHNYPLLISKDTSFVYFERKDIVGGAYKKDKFFFRVYPFEMDSVNSLPTSDLFFAGKFVSAGIFPAIDENIRVQKDYSLGFQHLIPSPGMPIYGNKGTFADTLNLSNRGLRGNGQLTYLSSTMQSKDFLFTPDSTSAKVQDFNLAKTLSPVEFPQVAAKNASVKWSPGGETMTIRNSKNEDFNLFENKASVAGTLELTPKGLRGKGKLSFDRAEVRSNSYRFNSESFSSDTADLRLNTPDRKDDALRVHVFKTEIDFLTRTGHFVASGDGALMEFPVIKYNSVVDEFDWLMDKEQLRLINNKAISKYAYYNMSSEQLVKMKLGREQYVSTDPKQDSLRFFALNAVYDLRTNVMEVEDARLIKVADAAIMPDGARLTIGKDGLVAPLKNAEILADTQSFSHRFYNAGVRIGSSHRYVAKGLYDYKPADGNEQTLEMKEIAVSSQGETFASATVSDSSDFMLNRHFKFKGKITVHAADDHVYCEGGYGMVNDCPTLKYEWIKLADRVDPKRLRIPVTDSPENIGNGKLRVSIYYSNTEYTVRPGFFVKPANVTDPDLFAATGFVTYAADAGEYRVADSSRLNDIQKPGDLLTLNPARCLLQGEGKLHLASNLGRFDMQSVGQLNYYAMVDSTDLSAFMTFDFLFVEEALKVLADDLNNSDLKGFDISSRTYTRALRQYMGTAEADKVLQELSLYGKLRKFPEKLQHQLVISNVQMVWNKDTRSFVSKGKIGISNLGKDLVNKQVKGFMEIAKKRSGDVVNLYLEPAENLWYYFTYSNGTLQALSSNKDFNDKISGLKEDKRMIKGEKGVQGFQFIIGTPDKKSVFVRKMKQSFGE